MFRAIHFLSFCLTLVSLGLTGCSLDIPLEDQVSDPDAITTLPALERAASAAYLSYDWHSFDLEFSIMAGEFQPTNLLKNNKNLELKSIWYREAIKDGAHALWKSHYKTIALCNTILERLDNVSVTGNKETIEKDALHGTTLLLKARCYLQLLQTFALRPEGNLTQPGIVLKDRVILEFSPRATIGECIAAIRQILTEGLAIMKDNQHLDDRWLGYHAGLLLSAQLELWSGNYSEALRWADELLQAKGNLIQGDARKRYEAMWTGKSHGDAVYTHDQTNKLQGTRIYLNEIQYDETQGDYFVVPTSASYADTDVRKGLYDMKFVIPAGDTVTLWGKYNYLNRNAIECLVTYDLQVTEALFIKAEALAHLGRSVESKAAFNPWLESIGLAPLPPSLINEALVEQIIYQKILEFRGSGLSYFDKKRLGMPIIILDSKGVKLLTMTPLDYRWCWPMPISEMKLNENMIQNPGWDTYIQ